MARIKLSNEIKKAISGLPDKEKDRLLYRLLAKEPDLVEQLEFRLLEHSATTEARREDVREEIEAALELVVKRYHSPGFLLLDVRSLSGKINHHVKITRDKYGEIALNLYLFNRVFELFGAKVKRAWPHRARTFNEYVVKRAKKLLNLMEKISEDYHADFQDDLHQLAEHIRQQPQMVRLAKQLDVDLDQMSSR